MKMVATFLTQLAIASLVFLLMLFIQGKLIFMHRWLLSLFFAIYLIDNILMVFTNHYSILQLIPNHIWEGFLVCNWSGKVYSIIFALALIYPCRKILDKYDVGLTFHQNSGSFLPACIVILALTAWAFFVGISSPKGKPDLQTLVYLAIIPGLNEELVYRGYLLGILDKLMPGKVSLFGAQAGWGVLVTSLLFGLLHGFWLDHNLAIHVEMIALRNATVSGLIFAWLRTRTGSLLISVLAHGVEDVLFFLPRMI